MAQENEESKDAEILVATSPASSSNDMEHPSQSILTYNQGADSVQSTTHTKDSTDIKERLESIKPFFTRNSLWQRVVYVSSATTIPDACALAYIDKNGLTVKLREDEYKNIEWHDESSPTLNTNNLQYFITEEFVDRITGALNSQKDIIASSYRKSLVIGPKKTKRAILECCNVKLADIKSNDNNTRSSIR